MTEASRDREEEKTLRANRFSKTYKEKLENFVMKSKNITGGKRNTYNGSICNICDDRNDKANVKSRPH